MASTDARPVPIKNTAFRAVFAIYDADGDLVSGASSLDSEVSKDQGTFADCTNEATEIATSSGMYYLDLTSTEMNADGVAVIVKTATAGAKTTVLVFYPQEAGDIKVDLQSVAGTTQTAGDLAALITAVDDFVDTEVAAILAAVDTEVAAIKTKTDQLAFTAANKVDATIQAAGDFAQGAADKVWGTAARVLTAGTNIALAKGTGVTGFNDLDAAGVRGAVGLASANLDTQLTTIDDFLDTEVAAILAAVDTEVAAIKAKTDNLPEGISKNTLLNAFEFVMVDSADHVTGKTGLTVAAERSIDGGAFAACANAPAEVGSGVYKIDLAASDLNGTVVTLKFTSAGADATILTIKTEVP